MTQSPSISACCPLCRQRCAAFASLRTLAAIPTTGMTLEITLHQATAATPRAERYVEAEELLQCDTNQSALCAGFPKYARSRGCAAK